MKKEHRALVIYLHKGLDSCNIIFMFHLFQLESSRRPPCIYTYLIFDVWRNLRLDGKNVDFGGQVVYFCSRKLSKKSCKKLQFRHLQSVSCHSMWIVDGPFVFRKTNWNIKTMHKCQILLFASSYFQVIALLWFAPVDICLWDGWLMS